MGREQLSLSTPVFIKEIRDKWASKFFDERAKLSVLKPYETSQKIEIEAHDITVSYFYYLARDRLEYYLKDNGWRIDLR